MFRQKSQNSSSSPLSSESSPLLRQNNLRPPQPMPLIITPNSPRTLSNYNSSPVYTSRLSNNNIGSLQQSFHSSSKAGFSELFAKFCESYLLQKSKPLNKSETLAPIRIATPSSAKDPLFSSDDEEEDKRRPGGGSYRGRAGLGWKTALSTWIVNNEIGNKSGVTPGKGDTYPDYQRGLGQGKYWAMTRFISLPVTRLALFSRLLLLGIQVRFLHGMRKFK